MRKDGARKDTNLTCSHTAESLSYRQLQYSKLYKAEYSISSGPDLKEEEGEGVYI